MLITDAAKVRIGKVFGNKVKHIRKRMQVKGRNASMLHSNSFRVSLEYLPNGNIHIVLWGAPSFYLEVGRKAGKVPPVSALFKWIKDKGIPYKNDKDRKSMAIAICKKIAKSGTKISRGPKQIIFSDFFDKATISVVNALILNDYKKQIKEKAEETLKKM